MIDDLLSINYVLVVETFNRKQYVCRIKDSSLFSEPSQVRQVEKEFSSTAVIKHKVEFFRILKRKLQLDYERVRNSFQHPPLRLRSLHLVPLPDLVFFQHFHGK